MERRLLLLMMCVLGALLVRAQGGYRVVGQGFAAGGGAVSLSSNKYSVAWHAGMLMSGEMKDSEGKLSFVGTPLLALPILQDAKVKPPEPDPVPDSSLVVGESLAVLSVRPNPASWSVEVAWQNGLFASGSRLELYSVAGVLALLVPTEGVGRCVLDVSALKPGLYMIRLVSSEGIAEGVGRLLVVR